jgi:dienelactone hydrolase
MGRYLTAGISLLVMMLFASAVFAEESKPKFPPDERINVLSLTLSNEQFLGGDTANGVPVTLTGDLRFPNWQERLPSVVLLHGSGGASSSRSFHWGQFLNKMGIATLRLDSFGGRSIGQVSENQAQLSMFAQVYDAYRAVDALATHPRMDPSRIAVMGFSRGGGAALYSSMRRFQDLYGPKGTHIAAHLPFYPFCNVRLIGELDIADAPLRGFFGAADDWNLVAPCREYIARLRATGKDVRMTEYPGAFHAFDDPNNRPGQTLPSVQNMAKCQRQEKDGKILNMETGKPFTYTDACVKRGATVGYDKAATAAAQAAVKEFLTEVFQLN